VQPELSVPRFQLLPDLLHSFVLGNHRDDYRELRRRLHALDEFWDVFPYYQPTSLHDHSSIEFSGLRARQ
jgi:hypothetical protein